MDSLRAVLVIHLWKRDKLNYIMDYECCRPHCYCKQNTAAQSICCICGSEPNFVVPAVFNYMISSEPLHGE